jgi:hypothetical protein
MTMTSAEFHIVLDRRAHRLRLDLDLGALAAAAAFFGILAVEITLIALAPIGAPLVFTT